MIRIKKSDIKSTFGEKHVLSVGFCKAQNILALGREFNWVAEPFMVCYGKSGYLFTAFVFYKEGQYNTKILTSGYTAIGINITPEIEKIEKAAYGVVWGKLNVETRKRRGRRLWKKILDVIFKQR